MHITADGFYFMYITICILLNAYLCIHFPNLIMYILAYISICVAYFRLHICAYSLLTYTWKKNVSSVPQFGPPAACIPLRMSDSSWLGILGAAGCWRSWGGNVSAKQRQGTMLPNPGRMVCCPQSSSLESKKPVRLYRNIVCNFFLWRI